MFGDSLLRKQALDKSKEKTRKQITPGLKNKEHYPTLKPE